MTSPSSSGEQRYFQPMLEGMEEFGTAPATGDDRAIGVFVAANVKVTDAAETRAVEVEIVRLAQQDMADKFQTGVLNVEQTTWLSILDTVLDSAPTAIRRDSDDSENSYYSVQWQYEEQRPVVSPDQDETMVDIVTTIELSLPESIIRGAPESFSALQALEYNCDAPITQETVLSLDQELLGMAGRRAGRTRFHDRLYAYDAGDLKVGFAQAFAKLPRQNMWLLARTDLHEYGVDTSRIIHKTTILASEHTFELPACLDPQQAGDIVDALRAWKREISALAAEDYLREHLPSVSEAFGQLAAMRDLIAKGEAQLRASGRPVTMHDVYQFDHIDKVANAHPGTDPTIH